MAFVMAALAGLALAGCEGDRREGHRRDGDRTDGASEPKAAVVEPEAASGYTAPTSTGGPTAGAISGRVVYRGPPPESTTMAIPEAGTLRAHTVHVDRESGGLAEAVIWIDGPLSDPGGEELEPAVLDQRDWTFLPHVLAVRVGQRVRMINSDIANHNIHSRTPGHDFNVGTPTGQLTHHRFRRATGARPVRIECNLHHWMLAWIYVFEHDAFAVTATDGTFRIDGVPAGAWTLRAHHADGGLAWAGEVRVAADGTAELTIELGPEAPDPGR